MEIVVPTTIKYSDAWLPFMACFRRFWPDCQFPVNILTDYNDFGVDLRPYMKDGDLILQTGEDRGWCKNFYENLTFLTSEFVLMLQEDFWLNAYVDRDYINKALKMMLDDDSIGCFRLYPCPGADIELGPDYGKIDTNAKYRVSCQAAIWRKDHLKDILSRFNRPNEFEIDGSVYVNNNCNNFKYYAVKRLDPNQWPIQYYCSAIARGQWNPDAVNFVRSLGIPVDTSRRPFLPIS